MLKQLSILLLSITLSVSYSQNSKLKVKKNRTFSFKSCKGLKFRPEYDQLDEMTFSDGKHKFTRPSIVKYFYESLEPVDYNARLLAAYHKKDNVEIICLLVEKGFVLPEKLSEMSYFEAIALAGHSLIYHPVENKSKNCSIKGVNSQIAKRGNLEAYYCSKDSKCKLKITCS